MKYGKYIEERRGRMPAELRDACVSYKVPPFSGLVNG